MATAAQIITEALKRLGVVAAGEVISGEDAADGLVVLNDMLDSWRTEALYVYAVRYETFAAINGSTSVTVGPGAQIDTVRPLDIEGNIVVSESGIDRIIEPITREQYQTILQKGVASGPPSIYYYYRGFPVGTLHFWPGFGGQYTIKVPVRALLQQFDGPETDVDLPPGYKRAIQLSLAEELAPSYQRAVTPDLARSARQSRSVVKRQNTQGAVLNAVPEYARTGRSFDVIAGQ